jgi:hypothetical protein
MYVLSKERNKFVSEITIIISFYISGSNDIIHACGIIINVLMVFLVYKSALRNSCGQL